MPSSTVLCSAHRRPTPRTGHKQLGLEMVEAALFLDNFFNIKSIPFSFGVHPSFSWDTQVCTGRSIYFQLEEQFLFYSKFTSSKKSHCAALHLTICCLLFLFDVAVTFYKTCILWSVTHRRFSRADKEVLQVPGEGWCCPTGAVCTRVYCPETEMSGEAKGWKIKTKTPFRLHVS